MEDLVNVDISALFSDDGQAIARIDQLLGEAIKNHGGFVISNFPEADSLDARARQLLRFFELPQDQKHQVAIRTNNEQSTHIYRGYESRLAVNNDLANNEMYDVGPDEPFPGPDVPGMHVFSETNLWPASEPFTGWQHEMKAYYQSLQRAGLAVVRSIGRFAGFTEQQLDDRFARGNSTLRLINYPVSDVNVAANAELPALRSGDDGNLPLTFGRHVDSAGISLLWQAQPGLQAQAPSGIWRDVPQIKNSISVHIGTVVKIMSDNQLPATPHRVIDTGGLRQSVAFFVEPALDVALAPIDSVLSNKSGSHPASGTYGWHLQETFHGRTRYRDLVPMPQ
jgi:isopenicillin N synthase-like dioxygenase